MRILTSLALLGLLLPSLGHADDSAADLDKLVVTATRTPTDLDNLPAPVIVISREEILRSVATDVAELLRFHAGIDLARSGGPGQQVSLFLRGTESDQTLVLIDGVPINPGTGGSAALQNIRPEMIERIEIVKGPRSALYGTEAIGGVINIITRKDADGLQGSAGLKTGSYATRSVDAGLSYGDTDTQFSLHAADAQSDGIPPRAGSNLDRGYDNRSFSARAGQDFGRFNLSVRHWQSEGRSEYLGYALDPRSQDYRNRASAADIGAQVTDTWHSRLTISHAIDDLTQVQINPFSGQHDSALTRRDNLDWQHDLALTGDDTLTAGFWFSREHTEANSYGSLYGADLYTRALYLENAWHGRRQDLVAAVREGDHDSFGRHLSWNLDYGLAMTDRDRLLVNAGSAFRAPNSTDLFYPGSGNPDLAPETAHNLELGYQRRFNRHWQGELRAYRNNIDDLIAYDPVAGRSENIDRARIRGLEASLNWTARRWRGRLSLTRQNPENAATGDTLLRRARKSLSASLAWQPGNWELGGDLLLVGPRRDIDPVSYQAVDNPGYGLLNLTAGLRLGSHLDLRLRVENVLDQDYQTVLGYNSPGRGAYLSLRYNGG